MTTQFLTPQELDRLLAAPLSSEPAPAGLNSPILGLLAATKRELLAEIMTEHYYPPGAVILKEGDAGDAMGIIRAGRVVVVKGNFNSPTILGYRGVGEIIGEMALLENKPRSASVIAIEDLYLLRIGRDDFQALRDGSSDFEMSISQALSARLRAADEARNENLLTEKSLSRQISELQTEKEQLLELQRLREKNSDFLVHDLRSPLSLVAGAINVLEMVLPEDILQANRQIFEVANINCQRLKRMIDSLLDIARLEGGETQLCLTLINLPDLIKNVMERMSGLRQSKNLTLNMVLPAELPLIKADEEKIDRVLSNLIDNALKFTPNGGQITLTAEVQDEQVLVSLANTGPIIPQEDRERIFDRFTQISGTSLRTRGSGLGLAFCRLAVEAHGGQIWVEPGEDGDGNRFVFSLPLSTHPPSSKG